MDITKHGQDDDIPQSPTPPLCPKVDDDSGLLNFVEQTDNSPRHSPNKEKPPKFPSGVFEFLKTNY